MQLPRRDLRLSSCHSWLPPNLEWEKLITVGASGAVMGLIGATAAMMFRGWLREGAVAARNRGLEMAGVVLGQMVIDTLVPQLSFTAHLSGAVIGFAITLLLGDRLARPASQAPRPPG